MILPKSEILRGSFKMPQKFGRLKNEISQFITIFMLKCIRTSIIEVSSRAEVCILLFNLYYRFNK